MSMVSYVHFTGWWSHWPAAWRSFWRLRCTPTRAGRQGPAEVQRLSGGAEGEGGRPAALLGEVLKEHRLRCQMTQEFVAESLGVSRQAVSKWETGTADPSTSNLLALARLFGVSAEELLRQVDQADTEEN